jgi:hypothetical protein
MIMSIESAKAWEAEKRKKGYSRIQVWLNREDRQKLDQLKENFFRKFPITMKQNTHTSVITRAIDQLYDREIRVTQTY